MGVINCSLPSSSFCSFTLSPFTFYWYNDVIIVDETDKKILNTIQKEFPIAGRPFAEIGKNLCLAEKEVLERVIKLKSEGYIRRIGPVLERKKLNYASTLCGVKVHRDILLDFVKELNMHKGVTHNYERDGDLNIWFTITAKKIEDIDAYLAGLEEKYELKIYRFPERKVFKIKTYFPL